MTPAMHISDDDVRRLMDELAALNHFLEYRTAQTVVNWYACPEHPLILQGKAGGGKTSLAIKIAQVKQASFYRISCHRKLGAEETLYYFNKTLQELALKVALDKGIPDADGIKGIVYDDRMMIPGVIVQAILDPAPHTVLLIDELDKIPAEEHFEALLLEYLAEYQVTITETGKVIKPAPGKQVHTVITSNAGAGGIRESLSMPILRRGRHIHIPEPTPVRQYEIIRRAAPMLSEKLARQCVLFVKRSYDVVGMKKDISLSETIMWAQSLQNFGYKELTYEAVMATVSDLAKGEMDELNLLDSTRQLIKFANDNDAKFLKEIIDSQENRGRV